jgi:hypothetical protein
LLFNIYDVLVVIKDYNIETIWVRRRLNSIHNISIINRIVFRSTLEVSEVGGYNGRSFSEEVVDEFEMGFYEVSWQSVFVPFLGCECPKGNIISSARMIILYFLKSP